jgi:O-methyltransferase
MGSETTFDLVHPYTLLDDERLTVLAGLVDDVIDRAVPGDIVECGVCNGGSAAALASRLCRPCDRSLWLYDLFDSVAPPGPLDGAWAQTNAGIPRASVETVRALLSSIGFPPTSVRLCPGRFSETLRRSVPDTIALLHLDCDWYDSVLEALELLYPRVAVGGAVILDDFGWWEGSRRAFFAYCRQSGIEPLLERCGVTQAYWIKGREHNRP